MKTFLAYAKLWWGATFGVSIALFGFPYDWSEQVYNGWGLVYTAGLAVLMVLSSRRILK